MAAVPAPDDREQIRAAVAARYAGLARAAQQGQAVIDGDPGEPAADCPTARCGPAWAAGTRSRWQTCVLGRRCWT